MTEKQKTEKPKRFKVDEDEYKQILRLRQIKKEDKQRNRRETIKINDRKIKYAEREILHKRGQIGKNVCVEKHDGYLGDLKPLFMLECDIEEITAQIEQLKEVNKAIKEEYDKDDS